jgi:hypothetical protein
MGPEWASVWIYPPEPRQSSDGAVFTATLRAGVATWIMTVYDTDRRTVEYVNFIPGQRVTQISITVRPETTATSIARVTYRVTALSREGTAFVAHFAKEFPPRDPTGKKRSTIPLAKMATAPALATVRSQRNPIRGREMPAREELVKETLLPADLSDEQFIAAMEQLRVAHANFHHRDHIRLAWAYLRKDNPSVAGESLANCIRHYAIHHGVPQKYHHTITLVWVRIVSAAMRLTPAIESFEPFAAAHPFLFDVRLPWSFYSGALLNGEAARAGWVEPDLHPLP